MLYCMNAKSQGMKVWEKLVVLTFDEIYLNNKVDINRKAEQAIGLHRSC